MHCREALPDIIIEVRMDGAFFSDDIAGPHRVYDQRSV